MSNPSCHRMRYMFFLSVLLIAIASVPSDLPAAEFRILTVESQIKFKIGHLGIGIVEGRFDSISGIIKLRIPDKSLSNLDISIATNSINTGIGTRDELLLGEDYLRAGRFPNITFQSTGLNSTNTGFTVFGKLLLRGVAKNVTLVADPPQMRRGQGGESQAVLTGRCLLKRKEIGLQFANTRDADEAWLGDSVELEFLLALQEVVP